MTAYSALFVPIATTEYLKTQNIKTIKVKCKWLTRLKSLLNLAMLFKNNTLNVKAKALVWVFNTSLTDCSYLYFELIKKIGCRCEFIENQMLLSPWENL